MKEIRFYNSLDFVNNRKDVYFFITKLREKYTKIKLLINDENYLKIDKEIWIFSQEIFIPHLLNEEIDSDFKYENNKYILYKIEDLNKIEDYQNENNSIVCIGIHNGFDEIFKKFKDSDVYLFTSFENDNFIHFFENPPFNCSKNVDVSFSFFIKNKENKWETLKKLAN